MKKSLDYITLKIFMELSYKLTYVKINDFLNILR